MGIQAEIEEARRRFANSLVGRWSTSQGTFDMVMGESWEIRPDGTGSITEYAMSGTSESRFDWRQSEPFRFEIRLVSDDDLDTPSASEDDEWEATNYDFVAVSTDVGKVVCLVEMSKTGQATGGFYPSFAPLSYNGPCRE